MWIVQSATTIKTWRCAVVSVRPATVRCCPLHLSQSRRLRLHFTTTPLTLDSAGHVRPLHALCLRPQLAPRSSQAATAVTHALPPPRTFTFLPRAKVLFPLRTPRFLSRAESMDLAGITNGVALKKTETMDKTGAAAILRVACSVQSCAVSCSCAPSTYSHRGR